MREDPNDTYDRRRCRTCGCAWEPGINELTGETEPGHDETSYCNRYRPIAPAWVAEALARHEMATTASNFLRPTVDDAEVARREVAGGVPTREWVAEAIDRHERSRDAACAAAANGKPTPAEVAR